MGMAWGALPKHWVNDQKSFLCFGVSPIHQKRFPLVKAGPKVMVPQYARIQPRWVLIVPLTHGT